MNTRTLRRFVERFLKRYNARVNYTDTRDRPSLGAYGTTGRPKGEGAHLSGRAILARRNFHVVEPPRPVKLPAARPGAIRRAISAIGRVFQRGAARGR